MIYQVQRYCVHDGRGIRTTIFFKGCQLHCPWCANPESQHLEKEIGFYAHKCVDCGECARVCPKGAIVNHRIDRNLCDQCGLCVYHCAAEALTIFGKELSVDELVEEACRDEVFYKTSGGGVTLSGGEAVLFPQVIFPLLTELKKRGIHVALESNGLFGQEIRQRLLPLVDQYLLDLKHMDSRKHKQVLGVGNEQALETIRFFSKQDLTIRIPLIPNFNDDEENLRRSARFARECAAPVDVLPFHAMGRSKYEALGLTYAYADVPRHTQEQLERVKEIFREENITISNI